jgi:hypothetical protein
LGNRSVFDPLHPNVGHLPDRWEQVDAPNIVLANEPMAEQETKTTARETCFVTDIPGQRPAERGDDKDSPDRTSTGDDVDAPLFVPPMQTSGRPLQEQDPWVRLLDSPERLLVTPSERARDPAGTCESSGGVSRLAEALHVHRTTRVQVPDERLVSVVARAPGCEPAKRPDGDGERKSQEHKARGKPQTAAGDPPYFLPPLCPFPPPCSSGGVVGAGSDAVGACFACPRGSPWWCSLERPNAFPCPCRPGAGAPTGEFSPWP